MSNPDPAEIFRTEAQDLLERIEQGLLDLEKDPGNGELVASVFRALHTLKGSGAMFGFDALASFTHHCETAFDRVRKGEAEATPALIGAVLSALDHMRTLAEGGPASAEQESALLAALQAAMPGQTPATAPTDASAPTAAPAPAPTPGAASTAATAAPAAPADAGLRWHIRYSPPPESFVNGERPLSLLEELRALGEVYVHAVTEAVPPLEALTPTECHLAWDVVLTTKAPPSAIEAVFIFVLDFITIEAVVEDDDEEEEEEPGDPETTDAAQVQAPDAPEVRAPGAVGEEMAATTPASGVAADAVQPSAPTPAPTAKTKDPDGSGGEADVPAAVQKPRDVGTLRVPAERLDELMDRVAELVIAQSRLKQVTAGSTDINLRAVAEEIERLASELRDSMMFVRMVPIAQLFGRFRRLIHDLSRDMGKTIELSTEGETTELDKTVIERLADPMVHLIRNSADHGLEPPEERAAAGKPAIGHIKLAARQTGGEVVVSVIDDGRGVDRAKVRAKAIANGLIAKTANLSDAELLQLLFQPGFSTAAKVTNLSGRGVGMDVVKRTIEALRGSIDITSEPGKGSRIDLRIPLTLAIIDGLLIRVGTNRYVIPLSSVEECVELTKEQDQRSSGRCFMTLRDALVPFIRLRDLFATGTDPDPYQKIVVVSTGTSGSERVGLVVDQIVGQHQTVIKPLSRFHADVETFAGATILGDGSVALILDIGHLVAAGQKQEERLRAVV